MLSGIKKNSFKQIEKAASRTKLIKSQTRCHKKLHKSKHRLKVKIKHGLKVFTGSKRIVLNKLGKQHQEQNELKARLGVIKSLSYFCKM